APGSGRVLAVQPPGRRHGPAPGPPVPPGPACAVVRPAGLVSGAARRFARLLRLALRGELRVGSVEGPHFPAFYDPKAVADGVQEVAVVGDDDQRAVVFGQ